MPGSSNPRWRYGIALFPLPPLLWLAGTGGVGMVAAISADSEAGALLGIGTFVLVVLSLVLTNLLAVVVAASLYLDARALARSDRDAPNQFLVGGVGLAYIAGELLPALYVALAPVIAYYLYRRRRYVPR